MDLPPDRKGVPLFSLLFMLVLFLINITEDLLMKREITTVLVSVALALIVTLRGDEFRDATLQPSSAQAPIQKQGCPTPTLNWRPGQISPTDAF